MPSHATTPLPDGAFDTEITRDVYLYMSPWPLLYNEIVSTGRGQVKRMMPVKIPTSQEQFSDVISESMLQSMLISNIV